MTKSKLPLNFLHLLFVITIFVFGCEPTHVVPLRECPPKVSVFQSLNTLRSSSLQLRPFIAYGKGRVRFYDSDKGKVKKENISGIKIWFEPPEKIRFWGDIVFDQRGIDIGSNEREFWFTARPKEVGNTYIWGLWSEQNNEGDLLLSPKILRQAFGIIEVNDTKAWTLASDRYMDVLTKRNEQNRLLERIQIDNCNYQVRQIEYFDADEKIYAVLKLDDYRAVDANMAVPAKIKIVKPGNNDTAETFEISLRSIKPQEKIKSTIFTRPGTKRFKNIYKMTNGKALEQPQQ